MAICDENSNKRFILDEMMQDDHLETKPDFKDAVLTILGPNNKSYLHLSKERITLARTRIITLYKAMKNQPALRECYLDQIKNVIMYELKKSNGKKAIGG